MIAIVDDEIALISAGDEALEVLPVADVAVAVQFALCGLQMPVGGAGGGTGLCQRSLPLLTLLREVSSQRREFPRVVGVDGGPAVSGFGRGPSAVGLRERTLRCEVILESAVLERSKTISGLPTSRMLVA